MSCYKPLHAFYTGLKTEKGKDFIIVKGNDVVRLPVSSILSRSYEGRYNDDYFKIEAFSKINPCLFPFVSDMLFYRYKEIPCGRCVGCRLEYSRQWAIRCVDEYEYDGKGLFITLTYDMDHIPLKEYKGVDLFDFPPLVGFKYGFLLKKDLQDFHKRLRKYLFGNGQGDLRYFCCGEYGGQTFRPHYHGVYFNIGFDTFDDWVLISRNKGQALYTSEKLACIWSKGNIIVGNVTFESCAYVARYVLKKQGSCRSEKPPPPAKDYPEFVIMSRRPAVGRLAFEKNHSEIFKQGEIFLKRSDGSVYRVKPPKRYSEYEKTLFPDEFKEYKSKYPDISFKGSLDYDLSDVLDEDLRLKNNVAKEAKERSIKSLHLRKH